MDKFDVTIDELRRRYSYDPQTGELTILVETVKGPPGRALKPPFQVCWNYKRVCITHVIWALHYGEWPEQLIDHKDRDRCNNRIDNLRLATNSQNGMNKRVPNSSCGLRGVSANKRSPGSGMILALQKAFLDGQRAAILTAIAAQPGTPSSTASRYLAEADGLKTRYLGPSKEHA